MKRSERKRDLRDKSPDELKTELTALYKEQFGLRMQKATQQLTNSANIMRVRRDIARVKTLLNQKAGQA
ncbi:MAG: 50S ribosomal protein L29 [Betaproteobacteria bacterium]|jgi:large subunit ribosomal protein L29|nr:MAG: 50S ribosomal protein L29 [Betaproteobacteria bacterium]